MSGIERFMLKKFRPPSEVSHGLESDLHVKNSSTSDPSGTVDELASKNPLVESVVAKCSSKVRNKQVEKKAKEKDGQSLEDSLQVSDGENNQMPRKRAGTKEHRLSRCKGTKRSRFMTQNNSEAEPVGEATVNSVDDASNHAETTEIVEISYADFILSQISSLSSDSDLQTPVKSVTADCIMNSQSSLKQASETKKPKRTDRRSKSKLSLKTSFSSESELPVGVDKAENTTPNSLPDAESKDKENKDNIKIEKAVRKSPRTKNKLSTKVKKCESFQKVTDLNESNGLVNDKAKTEDANGVVRIGVSSKKNATEMIANASHEKDLVLNGAFAVGLTELSDVKVVEAKTVDARTKIALATVLDGGKPLLSTKSRHQAKRLVIRDDESNECDSNEKEIVENNSDEEANKLPASKDIRLFFSNASSAFVKSSKTIERRGTDKSLETSNVAMVPDDTSKKSKHSRIRSKEPQQSSEEDSGTAKAEDLKKPHDKRHSKYEKNDVKNIKSRKEGVQKIDDRKVASANTDNEEVDDDEIESLPPPPPSKDIRIFFAKTTAAERHPPPKPIPTSYNVRVQLHPECEMPGYRKVPDLVVEAPIQPTDGVKPKKARKKRKAHVITDNDLVIECLDDEATDVTTASVKGIIAAKRQKTIDTKKMLNSPGLLLINDSFVHHHDVSRDGDGSPEKPSFKISEVWDPSGKILISSTAYLRDDEMERTSDTATSRISSPKPWTGFVFNPEEQSDVEDSDSESDTEGDSVYAPFVPLANRTRSRATIIEASHGAVNVDVPAESADNQACKGSAGKDIPGDSVELKLALSDAWCSDSKPEDALMFEDTDRCENDTVILLEDSETEDGKAQNKMAEVQNKLVTSDSVVKDFVVKDYVKDAKQTKTFPIFFSIAHGALVGKDDERNNKSVGEQGGKCGTTSVSHHNVGKGRKPKLTASDGAVNDDVCVSENLLTSDVLAEAVVISPDTQENKPALIDFTLRLRPAETASKPKKRGKSENLEGGKKPSGQSGNTVDTSLENAAGKSVMNRTKDQATKFKPQCKGKGRKVHDFMGVKTSPIVKSALAPSAAISAVKLTVSKSYKSTRTTRRKRKEKLAKNDDEKKSPMEDVVLDVSSEDKTEAYIEDQYTVAASKPESGDPKLRLTFTRVLTSSQRPNLARAQGSTIGCAWTLLQRARENAGKNKSQKIPLNNKNSLKKKTKVSDLPSKLKEISSVTSQRKSPRNLRGKLVDEKPSEAGVVGSAVVEAAPGRCSRRKSALAALAAISLSVKVPDQRLRRRGSNAIVVESDSDPESSKDKQRGKSKRAAKFLESDDSDSEESGKVKPKLAPLFAKRRAKDTPKTPPKRELTSAELEALLRRNSFLQSGVPDELRRLQQQTADQSAAPTPREPDWGGNVHILQRPGELDSGKAHGDATSFVLWKKNLEFGLENVEVEDGLEGERGGLANNEAGFCMKKDLGLSKKEEAHAKFLACDAVIDGEKKQDEDADIVIVVASYSGSTSVLDIVVCEPGGALNSDLTSGTSCMSGAEVVTDVTLLPSNSYSVSTDPLLQDNPASSRSLDTLPLDFPSRCKHPLPSDIHTTAKVDDSHLLDKPAAPGCSSSLDNPPCSNDLVNQDKQPKSSGQLVPSKSPIVVPRIWSPLQRPVLDVWNLPEAGLQLRDESGGVEGSVITARGCLVLGSLTGSTEREEQRDACSAVLPPLPDAALVPLLAEIQSTNVRFPVQRLYQQLLAKRPGESTTRGLAVAPRVRLEDAAACQRDSATDGGQDHSVTGRINGAACGDTIGTLKTKTETELSVPPEGEQVPEAERKKRASTRLSSRKSIGAPAVDVSEIKAVSSTEYKGNLAQAVDGAIKVAAGEKNDGKTVGDCIQIDDDDAAGDRSESMLWTDCYAPRHSTEVIGNWSVCKKLREWLREWKRRIGRQAKTSSKSHSEVKADKDVTDYEDSSNSASHQSSHHRKVTRSDDEGDDDDDDYLCNTMLLLGPPGGIGKTAMVYALSQELGFKVFEVNPSVQRDGRHLLTQLQEATQSHQVVTRSAHTAAPPTATRHPIEPLAHGPVKAKEKPVPPTKSKGSDVRRAFASLFGGKGPAKPTPVASSPFVAAVNRQERLAGKRKVGSPDPKRKVRESSRSKLEGGSSPRKRNSRRILDDDFEVDLVEEVKRPAGNSPGCPKRSGRPQAHENCSGAGKGGEVGSKRALGKAGERDAAAVSLILFDEVDVVLGEDRGFWGAVETFISTTKRPILLTATDDLFPRRFSANFVTLRLHRPQAVNIASYLQILCLLENTRVDHAALLSLVSSLHCDVRQSLLTLQFWVGSGGGSTNQTTPVCYLASCLNALQSGSATGNTNPALGDKPGESEIGKCSALEAGWKSQFNFSEIGRSVLKVANTSEKCKTSLLEKSNGSALRIKDAEKVSSSLSESLQKAESQSSLVVKMPETSRGGEESDDDFLSLRPVRHKRRKLRVTSDDDASRHGDDLVVPVIIDDDSSLSNKGAMLKSRRREKLVAWLEDEESAESNSQFAPTTDAASQDSVIATRDNYATTESLVRSELYLPLCSRMDGSSDLDRQNCEMNSKSASDAYSDFEFKYGSCKASMHFDCVGSAASACINAKAQHNGVDGVNSAPFNDRSAFQAVDQLKSLAMLYDRISLLDAFYDWRKNDDVARLSPGDSDELGVVVSDRSGRDFTAEQSAILEGSAVRAAAGEIRRTGNMALGFDMMDSSGNAKTYSRLAAENGYIGSVVGSGLGYGSAVAVLALDYMPAVRAVCRSEGMRKAGNTRRRFLHYLNDRRLKQSTLDSLSRAFMS